MEKIEVKEAKGKLGILVVGVGGAVATTMITGTLAARKGLAKPIGSISQLLQSARSLQRRILRRLHGGLQTLRRRSKKHRNPAIPGG